MTVPARGTVPALSGHQRLALRALARYRDVPRVEFRAGQHATSLGSWPGPPAPIVLPAPAVRALERRGLVSLHHSSVGRPTVELAEAGRALAALLWGANP